MEFLHMGYGCFWRELGFSSHDQHSWSSQALILCYPFPRGWDSHRQIINPVQYFLGLGITSAVTKHTHMYVCVWLSSLVQMAGLLQVLSPAYISAQVSTHQVYSCLQRDRSRQVFWLPGSHSPYQGLSAYHQMHRWVRLLPDFWGYSARSHYTYKGTCVRGSMSILFFKRRNFLPPWCWCHW